MRLGEKHRWRTTSTDSTHLSIAGLYSAGTACCEADVRERMLVAGTGFTCGQPEPDIDEMGGLAERSRSDHTSDAH